jgi:hypothetical protein
MEEETQENEEECNPPLSVAYAGHSFFLTKIRNKKTSSRTWEMPIIR